MEETLIQSTEPSPSDDGDPMDVVTGTQNPNNDHPSSNSDSGSDSESDDEAQAILELQTLETELSTNPANYDAHVQVLFQFCDFYVCLFVITCSIWVKLMPVVVI